MIRNRTSHHELLNGWEEVYKKGQLTLWVLVVLKEKPMRMKDIKGRILVLTDRTFSVDDNSMYRALNRYAKAGLVTHRMVPGQHGPDLKEYFLTRLGADLLQAFITRNITGVFYTDEVKRLMAGGEK